VATLTVLRAERARCPTVRDALVRQHTQHPSATKDAPAAAGFCRALAANVPFSCRASVAPGQQRAGRQLKLSEDTDTASQ